MCKLKRQQNLLFNEIRNSLAKIKRIEQIAISKPDKGSCVVILNKDEYSSKILK